MFTSCRLGYQLKNEPSINLHSQYTRPLSPEANLGQNVDLHAVRRSTWAMRLPMRRTGFIFRIGIFEPFTVGGLEQQGARITNELFAPPRVLRFFGPEICSRPTMLHCKVDCL